MIRFDDILEKVSAVDGERDINLLKKAYVFAARAHKGQTRRSGEPYLSHPLEVANMLADMRLDSTTLIAGLLHDVLEDTEVTAAEIRENFGAEVADLVDGVTKISRVQEASPEVRQAETIRKIILAMIGDLRVIFIKLVDRIHNLKTLKFLPEDKQKQIAKETLDIYAPIANRLGMGRIKAELEDLAFRYVDPDEYFRIAAIVAPERQKAEDDLARMKASLERLLRENGIPAEIQSRIKRLYSIHDKMNKQLIDFDQVYDFRALRIITDTVKNCYAALGIIHQKWPPLPHRFRDFIAMPKANLYRALHTTVITEDKQTFEIQIRTQDMHTLAENGIAAHWKYKDKDAARLVKQDKRLEWLREMVDLYVEQKSPREFLKNLKTDLIPEEVYAFTPKGKVDHAAARRLGPRLRLQGPFGDRPARRRRGHQRRRRASQDDAQDRRHRRDQNLAAADSALRLAEHGLHLGRPASDQALAQPPGKIPEHGARKRMWARQSRRFSLPDSLGREAGLLRALHDGLKLKVKALEDFYAMIGRGRVIVDEKFMDRLCPGGRPGRSGPRRPRSRRPGRRSRGRGASRFGRAAARPCAWPAAARPSRASP